MQNRSLIDYIVAGLYWPSFMMAVVVILLTPVAGFTSLIPEDILVVMTIGLVGFCVLLFVLMLFDKETRDAVNQFNERSRATWKSKTWSQRLFRRIGDRRPQYCCWVLLAEQLVPLFGRSRTLALRALAGFFQIALMAILTLKKYVHLQPIDS